MALGVAALGLGLPCWCRRAGSALCLGHGLGFSAVDRSARAGGRGLVFGCQGACGLRPPCVACFVPSCACRLRPGSRPAIVPAGALPCCPWPARLAFGVPDCMSSIARCSRFVKPFLQKFFRGSRLLPYRGSKKVFSGRNDPALCMRVIPYTRRDAGRSSSRTTTATRIGAAYIAQRRGARLLRRGDGRADPRAVRRLLRDAVRQIAQRGGYRGGVTKSSTRDSTAPVKPRRKKFSPIFLPGPCVFWARRRIEKASGKQLDRMTAKRSGPNQPGPNQPGPDGLRWAPGRQFRRQARPGIGGTVRRARPARPTAAGAADRERGALGGAGIASHARARRGSSSFGAAFYSATRPREYGIASAREIRYCARRGKSQRLRRAHETVSFFIFFIYFIHPRGLRARARARADRRKAPNLTRPF